MSTPQSLTPPSTAQIVTSANVTWADGSLFTGYLLVGTVPPINAQGTQYAAINLWGVRQRLPLWTVVPIIQGQVDTNTTLYFSQDIDPPGTQYVIYWFDSQDTRIFPAANVLPALITINVAVYTLAVPSLANPVLASSAFTPAPQTQTAVTNSGAPANYAIPAEVVLTGTADGTNKVFNFPSAPLAWASVFIDGQKQDPSTYTRVAAQVTFVTAPTAGSSITGYML